VRQLMQTARRLEGMTRHASVHAAGVVIAPKAIVEFAPLYKSAKDEITTQWAMKEVERVGLLKMDFLGLSTLTLLTDAVAEIKRTEGVTIDLDNLPLDDDKTYQLFRDGQTAGVFQFESSGMRDTLRKAKPQVLEDLIALNALYRPGPLKGGVVDDYIKRKHGLAEVKYDLPQMEGVLKETYGVIAYQEQVMRLASDLAGFTMGESDILRKAMGKKDPAVMAKQRDRFMEGCKARGIAEKKAAKIFDLMEFFAGYGFNKSHSTTYAYLAYQTAYLKANYPRHFMAALLTIEAQNTEKLAFYLAEARDLGVPVLPPDINRSELAFTVQPEGVRYGLTAVKNVGEGAILSLLAARKELGGRVTSLYSLAEHLDLRLVNKRPLESLVKGGAFDSLLEGKVPEPAALRARLFAAIDRTLEHGNRHQKDRDRGQSSMFGDEMFGGGNGGGPLDVLSELPEAKPWTNAEQLTFEKEALGLYISGHPIEQFKPDLAAFGAKGLAELTGSVDNVAIGGIVTGLRSVRTRRGDPMAVFMLEDESGTVETVVFPEAFAKAQQMIRADAMLVVRGRFEKDDDTCRMVASDITTVELMREKVAREVKIRVTMPPHTRGTLEALADILSRHRGDRKVSLEIESKDNGHSIRVKASTPQRVRPSDRMVAEVEALVGAGTVQIK
jgi:DNA polymerase-3 subunit alpha